MFFDRNRWPILALLLLLACVPARAQTSTPDFLPEAEAYVHLNSNLQLVFQAKEAIEDGDGLVRSELGPSVEFYVRPLEALKDVTVFDSDEAKCRPLLVSIGYRVMPSPNGPTIHRLEPVAMFHFAVKGAVLVTDKNRADLDWSTGVFTWRYRNQVTAERRITIHSYHPGPYASAEFFYESQFAKWSTTRLYAGCLLPFGKHF